jgi:hypothetical protein
MTWADIDVSTAALGYKPTRPMSAALKIRGLVPGILSRMNARRGRDQTKDACCDGDQ